MNLFNGDVIKTTQHFPFHLVNGPCMAGNAESKFCCTPILLNEIEFTVVFGIVVTQMAIQFNILLKQWLL